MRSKEEIPCRIRPERCYLDEWVRAINDHGGFGTGQWAISKDPADLGGILEIFAGKVKAKSS